MNGRERDNEDTFGFRLPRFQSVGRRCYGETNKTKATNPVSARLNTRSARKRTRAMRREPDE